MTDSGDFVYIGLEMGLHGVNLPEPDQDLANLLIEAVRAALPDQFEYVSDITLDFTESARDGT